MRDDDSLVVIFKDAFRPLTCDAEVTDYGKHILFKIFDRAGKLVRVGRYQLTRIRTDTELKTQIESARDAVEAKLGFKLDPWNLPPPK